MQVWKKKKCEPRSISFSVKHSLDILLVADCDHALCAFEMARVCVEVLPFEDQCLKW